MLILSSSALESVLTHARAEAPDECCGVLVGTRRDGDGGERIARVERAERATNAAATPETAYEIPPSEVAALADEAERAGAEIAGFYHSHPAGPPAMSATDEAEAAWTGYHYLLVSLAGPLPYLDAWVWTGDGFESDAVVVRDARTHR